jgi:hypothetical protein
MSEEPVQQCHACGATIYQEHLDTGIAGYFQGALLCLHCRQEKIKTSGAATAAVEEELETIALVDDETAHGAHHASPPPPPPRKPSGEPQHAASSLDAGLRRELLSDGVAATRCRTFHAKLNEGAVAYMNRQVNEWADADDQIKIKFATSAIGVFEGKHSDPHLIVTVFY